MDPRRLDRNHIRQILNCEPPMSGIKDLLEDRKIEPPKLVLNMPKLLETQPVAETPQIVNKALQEKTTHMINTKNNPEILQYLPQLPSNTSIYIEINIYMVEDDVQNTAQTNGTSDNVQQMMAESQPNNSSLFSDKVQNNDGYHNKKLYIPNLNNGFKKSTIKIDHPLSENDMSSGRDSDDISESELEKRQSCYSDDRVYEDQGNNVYDLFDRVKKYWTNRYAIYPITFKKKSMFYSSVNGEYCNLELVDYSNKIIPQ